MRKILPIGRVRNRNRRNDGKSQICRKLIPSVDGRRYAGRTNREGLGPVSGAKDIKMNIDQRQEQRFTELNELEWKPVFSDSGKNDWNDRWFLDGERAIIRNTTDGMVFSAGPVYNDHASHGVLWTKDVFSGEVKIEFDYTRLDTIQKCVNIIYILATGTGDGPYKKDIAEWSSLRAIPYMRSYFENMNLLHISFAAYGDVEKDYVRVRRYPIKPNLPFDKIAVPPDYFGTGLFDPGITYHFTIIKKGHELLMKVEGAGRTGLFAWFTSSFPPVEEGRIGLRHMFTRCARYKDITISIL